MESDRVVTLRAQARQILDRAEAAKRADLDPDEEREFEELLAEIRVLKGEEPMTPISGSGWRVSPAPRWPHARLEALAAEVMRECFPWGTADAWQWRWGVLDGPFGDSAARCFYRERLVLVDEQKLAQRADRDLDLWKSITEELTHIQCGYEDGPDDPLGERGHSNRFYRVLSEARSKVPRIVAPWLWSR
jgi:hypothetical protein